MTATERLKILRRADEILEETRRERLAEEAAAELGMPAGEPISGLRQTAAAVTLLEREGKRLNDEEALTAALNAVGEFPDDVTVLSAPLVASEPVEGEDDVESARKLLSARGEEETEETFLAALAEARR